MIDSDDFTKVRKLTWRITNTNEIVSTLKTRKIISLTNYLYNCKGSHILHKNNNSLDCRRNNLFINNTYYLGLFKNKNDAIKARIKAENNLNLFLDIR